MHNFTRNSPTLFKVLLCMSLSVQVWSLRRLCQGETFSHRVTTLVYIQILYRVVYVIKIGQFHNIVVAALKTSLLLKQHAK